MQLASQEDIARIAKIVARATSVEPNEANSALHAAYKRMRRDQVGIRHLLTLPLSELYQEALVKLVMLILESQSDLSPHERRKAFETYITLISNRFSAGEYLDPDSSDEHRHESEARAAADAENHEREREREVKAREKAQRRGDDQRQEDREAAAARQEEQGRSEYARQSDIRPSKPPSNGSYAPIAGALGVLGIVLFAFSASMSDKSPLTPPPMPVARSTEQAAVPPVPVVSPTHAVAALNANLRSAASSKSAVKHMLARGELLTLISTTDTFLEVRTSADVTGFIASELVIPATDLPRLVAQTARSYVDARASENRLQALLTQAKAQDDALLIVMVGLKNRSAKIANYLEPLHAARTFKIDGDLSAATWFSLSARASLSAGNFEDAAWEARAAIEADPTNSEHHVAFGLAKYRSGNDAGVFAVGRILPRLAPATTNAWTLFALAQSMDDDPDAELTKGAFVLAIRLSKNAESTKRYFRELAENARNPLTKELIYAALAEERESPELFASATEFRAAHAPQ